MSRLSDYNENLLLNWHLTTNAATRPTAWFLGLGTGSSDSGLTGEPSGDGYARQAVSWTVTGSTAENSGALSFGPATASWGTISHVAVFDAVSGGNMLWHGPVAASQVVNNGVTVTVAAGTVTLTLD